MTINIGENIRRLRGERSLTQEQLAYELKVSPQAVSRWETGGALPDISMLPVIADFFDVTLDELMGRGIECPSDELERLLKQASELKNSEKPDDAMALARKAAGKYPRDEYILMMLANQLYNSSLNSDCHKLDDEIIELCEKVCRLGKHPDMWVMATQRLVKLYIRAGQLSKAHSLAGKLPSLFCSREIAVRDSLDGENKLDCCLNNIKTFSLLLTKELNIAARISAPSQRAELEKAANLISDVVDTMFK